MAAIGDSALAFVSGAPNAEYERCRNCVGRARVRARIVPFCARGSLDGQPSSRHGSVPQKGSCGQQVLLLGLRPLRDLSFVLTNVDRRTVPVLVQGRFATIAECYWCLSSPWGAGPARPSGWPAP